ncbi:MAG: PAS domain-containing protein [Proteobacteria bacterium]|nr:PAS domain-containing protein [Pseudomonadota bacterium]MBU4471320.1 PAS domain-containing protein [Pseudomonadota bacterium]MCG2751675.1 ATP-binding protein [Desulfobacteraceae bacterium]
MNIAIVGGDQRCLELIELIQRHHFQEITPQILAVADEDQTGPGIVRAKEMGFFVTSDYNEFFKRDDINLIIELKDDMDIYNDILEKKGKNVRAISSKTAQLFWEIGMISDLHRNTSNKLQKIEAMSDLIFNTLIHEEVLVISRDYRILDVNDTLLRKTGLKRDEVIGRFCYEITHHLTAPCMGLDHPCPLVETLKSGNPSQATHTHLDKDNRELFYAISCYPIYENSKITGVVEMSRDITRDINYQKTMMHQEKMISIGRLSAGVAHEINNPLTTILTTAILLQEDMEKTDPLYGELETISKETIRCREIVTSLLDFARQSAPEKKQGDINAIISESVLLTKKQAAFSDIHISLILDKNIPLVLVDRGQIQQAMINLLINAVEATGTGGSIKVVSRLDSKKNNVEIDISDTGVGMDEKTISRIFDPFFTNKETGTGLGLAITLGIIEQHDGGINVKSRPGKGTTFTIKFPLKNGDHDA